MARYKFKKDESVKYGPFAKAKVVNPKPNRMGYIEIETPNGTKIMVPESDVTKN